MENRTKIDRLAVSVDFDRAQILEALGAIYGPVYGKPQIENVSAAHGFESAATVIVGGVKAGWWAWGGDSQRGRSYLDITGVGCGLVSDWKTAQEALWSLPRASVKRCDIAADFYRGEVTYEDTLEAYRAGKFQRGGRPPSMHQRLPDSEDEGRTIYVGKREAAVFFRGYEKGKKEFQSMRPKDRDLLGSPSLVTCSTSGVEPYVMANWYRLELELKGRKAPLPEDIIERRDQYFAGAYPYLAEVLPDVDAQILVTPKQIGIANVEAALEHIRQQYGRTLFTALTVFEGDFLAVWDRIVGKEHSPRLIEAGALLDAAQPVIHT